MGCEDFCKHCGVVGSHEFVTTIGKQHAIDCPRCEASCTHCKIHGSLESVTSNGAQHTMNCPRHTCKQQIVCEYCNISGSIEVVTSIGSHHAYDCIRYTAPAQKACTYIDVGCAAVPSVPTSAFAPPLRPYPPQVPDFVLEHMVEPEQAAGELQPSILGYS